METQQPIEAACGALPAPSGQAPLRWQAAAVATGVLLLLALFTGGMILIPRYQAAHPYSDLQRSDANQVYMDDLFLDVTLVTPEFLGERNLSRYFVDRDPATVLPVLVGLNTHTGDIGHMTHLPGEISLVGPAGESYPALTEPIVMSQHHNAYMLLFPARDSRGVRFLDMTSGTLTVQASGMGDVPVREFAWELPLRVGPPNSSLVARMMLALALVSALLVVLSPCALELTLYYTAIISCTVTDGERAANLAGSPAPDVGQRKVLLNLGSFVAGFTLLYAVSGATVGLIGAGMRQPLGAYSGLLQVFGGVVILYFAARVAGLDRWVIERWPWRRAEPSLTVSTGPLAYVGQLLTRLRQRGQARAREGGMRARDSFLVGMGLSSACLTCMGGAVLYPLLVYAGITSWYSGMITLTLYSLLIAVPMVFIALGFFQIRMSLTRRVGLTNVLRYASATMLAGIGLLILSGSERVIADIAFGFLGTVSRWVA
jgi:cytochrome c-type biogenesis protein